MDSLVNIPKVISTKQNYYVDCHGADAYGLGLGFMQAIKMCISKNLTMLLFAVNEKDNLKTPLMDSVFGLILAKLYKNGVVKVNMDNKEIDLVLFSSSEAPIYWHSVILAIHIEPELMNVIDAYPTNQGIVFVPWIKDDNLDWINRNNAIKIKS